jgi:RNA polymerase sigma-70 factor (sigma-E family)
VSTQTDERPAVRPATFEELVHATGERMLRTAVLLCGDRHRAEDLVQSAYATALARWRLVARAEHPAAYVRTILTRTYLAEQRRRRVVELPLETDAPARADDTALRLSLLQALDALPPLDRAVVVLRYWEDLSVARTAEQLGITENACRTRASRALARLRTLHPDLAPTPEDQP